MFGLVQIYPLCVFGLVLENSLESHKPVEISDLRPCGALRGAGYTRVPTQRGKAAEGPQRAGNGEISLAAGLD